MEQRYVIAFLTRRGMDGKHIHAILKETYGDDSYKQTQVYYWMAEVKAGRTDLSDLPRSGRPSDDGLTRVILNVLEIDPHASARKIARRLFISPSTVVRYLEDNLGYKCVHLRWVPHILTNAQKLRRLEDAKAMLPILLQAQADGWHYLVTGDESWFEYYYEFQTQWVLDLDDRDDIESPSFTRRKTMFIIFFGPNGLVLCQMIPQGQKITADYFIENVLDPISKMKFYSGHGNFRNALIHYDNARVHTAKKCDDFLKSVKLTRLKHPAYSPDLAPCDFGIFGTMKTDFRGKRFPTEDDLLDAVTGWFQAKTPDFFKSVLNNWIVRLQACIKAKGDYFTL